MDEKNMWEMESSLLQDFYRTFRAHCSRNTASCFEFIRKLCLGNPNGLKMLLEMNDLCEVERQYIKHLLKEEVDTWN